MRDFQAGRDINVGGNVHIYDASEVPKMLFQCTSQALLDEQTHRRGLLEDERKRKGRCAVTLFLVFAAITIVVALWLTFIGYNQIVTPILALGAFFSAFAGIKAYDLPTEFEQRQLEALKEIHYILRERSIF